MKILVTGCAGATGSATCEELIKRGHRVVGVDNLFAGSKDNLAVILDHAEFTFIEGDILDEKLRVSLADESFQAIYHFAAIVETKHFYESPILTYDVNCQGTKLMLEFAKVNGVESFLNASSSEVYGHQQEFPSKESNAIVFDSPVNSMRWSYAAGKLMGEYLGLAFSEHFKVVSVRYANLYGPRDLATNHLIPHALRNITQGKPVVLTKGSDERMRSFLHTDDCVSGTLLALEKGMNGSIYGLGGSEELTVTQVVEKLAQLSGQSVKIEYEGERAGDVDRRLVDTSALVKDTGWQQNVALELGLKQMIEIFTSGVA